MKIIRKAGDTSNILQIFIQDSSSTTGAGLAGLVFNSASLTAYYHKDTDTTATAITLVTMTVGTFTSSGFKEIDATNMPGWYQFCPPDAALSTSGTPKSVGFHLKGATNMAPLAIEVQLVAVDVQSATSFGISNLDAAITSRLAPTVAARTLDVSTGGEAGLDWANVGSPTSALALTGTTIAVTQKVDVDSIKTSATAATNLQSGAIALVPSTCAVGSTTTSIVTNLTEATDTHYNGRVVTFTSGALLGQASNITNYNGTTKTLTVTALTEAPANTDGFVIS